MADAARNDRSTVIGVLAAEGCAEDGWTCGYLLINRYGRPLEFRCTDPVTPSSAHRILYGPTLREFVLGELAGPLLVQQARNRPAVICCDSLDFLSLRRSVEIPVLALFARDACEAPATAAPRGLRFDTWDSYRLAVLEEFATDLDTARSVLEQVHAAVDLLEPFDRVQQALREAVRGGQGAA